MAQKTLRILPTRFSDPVSQVIRCLTVFPYTHASIGLEEEGGRFYSFLFQGFVTEEAARPGRRGPACALYEVPVTEEAYGAAKATLADMTCHREEYHYDPLGLVLSFLHIPHRFRKRFFCSQFVAYVLGKSRAVPLGKSDSLYFPRDLSWLPGARLVYQGRLGDVPQSAWQRPAAKQRERRVA